MGGLFDSSQFVTRNHCGAWTPLLESVYIISNILIAVSYFVIPFILINVWRQKRRSIEAAYMIILFSTFIFLCGVTHLTDVLVFWWAPYRFYVLIYFLTGAVSFYTMLNLPFVIKKKLRLISREDYHRMNNELQKNISQKELAIIEKDNIIEELRIQLHELERMKARGIWFSEQETVLVNLKKVLTTRFPNGD